MKIQVSKNTNAKRNKVRLEKKNEKNDKKEKTKERRQ